MVSLVMCTGRSEEAVDRQNASQLFLDSHGPLPGRSLVPHPVPPRTVPLHPQTVLRRKLDLQRLHRPRKLWLFILFHRLRFPLSLLVHVQLFWHRWRTLAGEFCRRLSWRGCYPKWNCEHQGRRVRQLVVESQVACAQGPVVDHPQKRGELLLARARIIVMLTFYCSHRRNNR